MKDHKAERSDATQFIQPRAEYMDLIEISTERNTKEESTHQVADYAPLHPLTRSWEVPRDHVTVDKSLEKVLLVRLLREQLRNSEEGLVQLQWLLKCWKVWS